jgi:hypothetical protein
MTLRRLAIRIGILAISILWASWALNNDLVERGWIARGGPLNVTALGFMLGWGVWLYFKRPWEREERTPYFPPPAEGLAERERSADPLVPPMVPQGMDNRVQRERTGPTVGDALLFAASVILLAVAITELPSVMEGLRSVW